VNRGLRATRNRGKVNQLGTIVQSYRIRRSIAVNQPTQDAYQARRRNRRADLNCQAFSVRLINDIQRPEPSPAVQGIVHEIQGPTAVRLCGQVQRLPRPIRQPLPRAPGQVQTHIAIHSMNTFLVPAVAIKAQPGKTFPEPPASVPSHDGVERIDYLSVPLRCWHWPLVVRRPR